jgi:hypothetical protein
LRCDPFVNGPTICRRQSGIYVEWVNVVPRRHFSSGDRFADFIELLDLLSPALITPDRIVEFGTSLVNVICDHP